MYHYAMATTILASGHLHLASDECETCGTNSNELEWTWDGNWIKVHASVGCYGTYDQYMDTPADIEEFLADFKVRFPDIHNDLECLAADLHLLLKLDTQAALDHFAGEFEGVAICRECGQDLSLSEAAQGLEYHEDCV